MCATRRGVELAYEAPGERWFRVVAHVAPGRPGGLEVRGIPGPDADLVARLAKAVEHRLIRTRGAREWLQRAADFVAQLDTLTVFGGDGGRHAELDGLLHCVAKLREGPGASLDPSELDAALSAAAARLGEETVAELGLALDLASGHDHLALARWAAIGPGLLARDDRRALACAALVQTYLGKIDAGQAAARAVADLARDATDARYAGELLERVGLPELAAEQLRRATNDALGDAGAFDVFFRLAQTAKDAHAPDLIHLGAAGMVRLAQADDQRLLAAQMQQEAGDFLAAEATLTALVDAAPGVVEAAPEHREATLTLAASQLWRDAHGDAAARAKAWLANHPDDAAALRILGAARHRAGASADALAHLTRALELDPNDDEAKLWRAEVLEALGELHEARTQVLAVTLGDHPAWQLRRASIEERAEPGRRIGLDTWFIVDQNIRQLLGDATPAVTNASHEQALELIAAALETLAGNRSARLTRPNATRGLVWIDEIESPRQRSEHLQLRATHRPIAEVLATFETLAEQHPSVPFFVTYPAELLLWRGEYDQARTRFDAVWEATRTRWGYVGAGAAAMLCGDDERALTVWNEGKQYYTWIDAEATYCYRGELYRRRGELELARPDLELAIRARPTRLGAWINLALLEHAQGRDVALRAAVAEIEALAPAYVWEAKRQAGVSEADTDAAPDTLAVWLRTLLELMRGNRSSVLYTLVDEEGLLRVIPVAPARVWHDYARQSLGLFMDELLTALARRQGL